MKLVKTITIVLALVLLAAPILVAKPSFSQSPVSFSAEPKPIPPLTNVNSSINGLEVPTVATPSSWVGYNFTVELHMLGATVANVPAGVGGVEIHWDFSSILLYAVPTGFTQELGTTGGALNPPLLAGITAGFYKADGTTRVTTAPYTGATQYIDAEAGSGSAWNGADGLMAIITFEIIKQPSGISFEAPFSTALPFTGASGAVDGSANAITLDLVPATVQIDATQSILPGAPSVFITPPSFTNTNTTLGNTFNYTVMITADAFWDIGGFDITVNWNASLLGLVAYSEGGFLKQGGAETFGFFTYDPIGSPGQLEAVFTKLEDLTPSSGTDSLLQLEFNATFVGTSFPPLSSTITLNPVDLVSWAHPERSIAPWHNSITAVDLAPDPGFTVTGATYTAPFASAGGSIDLYDQYPTPYGGQGPGSHSDSFAPQQQVILNTKVTFGGDAIAGKLVAFEIDDAAGQKLTILQNITDANGVATVSFRIPTNSTFGWWKAIANVEVDQATLTDTMFFQVGWLAQVTSVVPSATSYLKQNGVMNFTWTLTTIHEQNQTVLVSIDSYDSESYPIGETVVTVIDFHATRVEGNPGNTTAGTYTSTATQPIPAWARVGLASVIGYALTDFPRNGGYPLGPPSPTAYFTIKIPSP